MRESPIYCDNLLTKDAKYGVKMSVPKLLLEFSMQQLHNDLISSPDDGGLLVSINANTNDVIISDTMLCSLAHPQLSPMTDHQKNDVWLCHLYHFKLFSRIVKCMAVEKIKNHERKKNHSRGSKKDELTQAYK